MSACNGCMLEALKARYGDKLIRVGDTWYLRGEQPTAGQSEPYALPDGTSIRFVAWFMSEGHAC